MYYIYQIKNKINSKSYIGSTKSFKKRVRRHLRDLRKGKHHSIYLQRAYNKYGEENFIFSILEECESQFDRELFWIEKIKPEYNIGSVGGGDNITKHPNYLVIKEKLIKGLEKARKVPKSDISGNKNPNWRNGSVSRRTTCICGNSKSYHAKKCMSCTNKSGINNHFYGKKHSKESLGKMRLKQLGKKPSNRKKCSIDDVIYESATEASKILNIHLTTVTFRLKSNNIKFKTWYYL